MTKSELKEIINECIEERFNNIDSITEDTEVVMNESKNNKVYDKVKWHIDGGENKATVIKRFSTIFKFLNSKSLLTKEGKEEMSLLSEDSIISSSMVNEKGESFLDKYYDNIISESNTEKALNKYYSEFNK